MKKSTDNRFIAYPPSVNCVARHNFSIIASLYRAKQQTDNLP